MQDYTDKPAPSTAEFMELAEWSRKLGATKVVVGCDHFEIEFPPLTPEQQNNIAMAEAAMLAAHEADEKKLDEADEDVARAAKAMANSLYYASS